MIDFERVMQDIRSGFENARSEIHQSANQMLIELRASALNFHAEAQGRGEDLDALPLQNWEKDLLVSCGESKVSYMFDIGKALAHSHDRAKQMIGHPYKYGGGDATGPTVGIVKREKEKGFDCSGLVVFAWADSPYEVPRTTGQQYDSFRAVSRGQVVPGTLAFTNFDENNVPGHVSIMSEYPDKCIEAGDPVGIYNFDKSRGRIEYGVPVTRKA